MLPSIYRPSSKLSTAFDELQLEMVALDRAWTCERERSGLRHAAADIRHHVCAALAELHDLDNAVPGIGTYDRLDETARVLAHEAFLSVLALGQMLRRAAEDDLAAPMAIGLAQLSVGNLLDELAPHVSRSDDALRRVLLDDVPLEESLAGVARAP